MKPRYTTRTIGLRTTPAFEARLRTLSRLMTRDLNRRVTITEIILTCLNSKLPEIESKHAK